MSHKIVIFVIFSVSQSKTIKVSVLDFQIQGLAIYITFIYPWQCYSTSASGAEQATETNHLRNSVCHHYISQENSRKFSIFVPFLVSKILTAQISVSL